MKPESPLSFLLFFQFTNAAPITLYYRKGVSEGCINGSRQQLSVKGFGCQIPVSKPSEQKRLSHVPSSLPTVLENEDDKDEEAMWFNNRPILPPSTMTAEEPRDVLPLRTIPMMRRQDGLVWEEDGIVWEHGREVRDRDNANLLIALLVLAFLCIIVGTVAAKRNNER
ncbi:hypothetical protein B7463_g12192, partial [Scytalidium lignicola]